MGDTKVNLPPTLKQWLQTLDEGRFVIYTASNKDEYGAFKKDLHRYGLDALDILNKEAQERLIKNYHAIYLNR